MGQVRPWIASTLLTLPSTELYISETSTSDQFTKSRGSRPPNEKAQVGGEFMCPAWVVISVLIAATTHNQPRCVHACGGRVGVISTAVAPSPAPPAAGTPHAHPRCYPGLTPASKAHVKWPWFIAAVACGQVRVSSSGSPAGTSSQRTQMRTSAAVTVTGWP